MSVTLKSTPDNDWQMIQSDHKSTKQNSVGILETVPRDKISANLTGQTNKTNTEVCFLLGNITVMLYMPVLYFSIY